MADRIYTDTGEALKLIDLGDDSNARASASAYKSVTLLASKTVTAAGTVNETAVTGLGGYKQAQVMLVMGAGDTDTNDTMDVYIDTSPDSGTTWINVGHFTQATGTTDAFKEILTLDPSGAAGTAVIDVTSNCAAAAVRPSMFCDRLRVRHISVDPDGTDDLSFAFSVVAFVKA